MPVLSLEDLTNARQLIERFVRRDVAITLFTTSSAGIIIPGRECPSCGPVQQLLEEIVGLSSRLTLETVDYYTNQVDARASGIARIPGITVGRNGDRRIRYFGMPAERQLPVFVSALIRASERSSPLKLETRRRIRRLQEEDVNIQVFVMPDSEHCAGYGNGGAIAMAAESSKVTTDVIDVGTFPEPDRSSQDPRRARDGDKRAGVVHGSDERASAPEAGDARDWTDRSGRGADRRLLERGDDAQPRIPRGRSADPLK